MLNRLNEFMDSLSSIDNLQTFKKETLQLFENKFHLEHSIFWLSDKNNTIHSPTTHQISSKTFQKYQDYYFEHDALLPKNILKIHKKPRYLTIVDVIDKRKYEETEYYNEFIRPQYLQNELGMYLYDNEELIGGISFAVCNYDIGSTKEEKKAFYILSQFISLKLEKFHRNNYTHIKMSKAEKRVFERLLNGETDKEIATNLHLSIYTVKKHLQNLYKKNNVSNRAALVALASTKARFHE